MDSGWWSGRLELGQRIFLLESGDYWIAGIGYLGVLVAEGVSRFPFNMALQECPFCIVSGGRVILENSVAVAFRDGFPVVEGHTLVVPRRHVASLFDLTEDEQTALWKLVATVRGKLMIELQPDGFNIGVNDGTAAGQTVMHAHVHIIPRRQGDVADPRGGIRWVFPKKARYWNEEQA